MHLSIWQEMGHPIQLISETRRTAGKKSRDWGKNTSQCYSLFRSTEVNAWWNCAVPNVTKFAKFFCKKQKSYLGFLLPQILQIEKHFTNQFHQAQTSHFWRVTIYYAHLQDISK